MHLAPTEPSLRIRRLVGVAVFVIIWSLTTHGKPSNSGDEPHYMMVMESLLRDRDLNLENNYAERHGAIFGRADLLMEAHARRTPSGAVLPVHDVGLPVFLLPIYAAATRLASVAPENVLARFRMNRGLFAYSLIGLTLIGMTAAAALLFFDLLSGWCTPALAALAAVVTFASPPILANAFVIFPEVPALFVSTAVLYYAFRRPSRLAFADAALIAVAVGVLPWFHRKYLLFALGLATAAAIRNRRALAAYDPRRLAGLLALLLFPMLALFVWTSWKWGYWGGPLALDGLPFSMEMFKRGAVGLLVDRESGLLPWAPVWFALPAAAWLTRRETWMAWIPVALLFVPSAAHDSWWAGWSPVGRFLVPLIPWLGLPLALMLRSVRARGVLALLLLLQLFIVAHGWQRPRSLWPKGDGVNAALESVPLVGKSWAAEFPSLRTSPVAPRDLMFPLAMLAGTSSLIGLGHRKPDPSPPPAPSPTA